MTHVLELKAGRAVKVPSYDFTRHARLSTPETVPARRAIIVEGILIFTDAALRGLMDIKVRGNGRRYRFIRRLSRRRGARQDDGVGD